MGVTYTWAGGQTTDAGDVVSVGSKGYERQIINVSPGDISATSTDAINGSQLYGVLSALERVRYFSVKSTDGSTDGTKNWNNDGAKGANSIAIGSSASTTSAATNGIAIGNQANVTGVNAVALGNGTTASVQDSALWAMVLSARPIILTQQLKMPHLKMIVALRPMSAMLLLHPLQQARFL